jgi:hypothetical protein
VKLPKKVYKKGFGADEYDPASSARYAIDVGASGAPVLTGDP